MGLLKKASCPFRQGPDIHSQMRTEFRERSLQHARSHHTTPLLAHGDAQYCSESTHFLLIQQQQTQGCLQHHLSHVLVVHAIGFCIFRNFYMNNTITLNSTMVTQGTQNPTSANPILLIKAEFNFSQLTLDLCENSAYKEPVH